MDSAGNENPHLLEPHLLGDSIELTAVQKSGLVQFGGFLVGAKNSLARAALGYRRYRDCDATDAPGQDYAAVRGDGTYLVGVLADGVGQSFYGNLAAHRLCSLLLPALWKSRHAPPGTDEMERGLKKAEHDFSEAVASYSLDHLPGVIRAALEATRREGSQAVFAAFIWNYVERTGALYQVGDAIAFVVKDELCTRIEANPRGRWSSAGKSDLLLLKTSLEGATAILIKSDGADKDWGTEIERQTSDLPGFLEMAGRRSGYDDVSFVSGSLGIPLPKPAVVRPVPAAPPITPIEPSSPQPVPTASVPVAPAPNQPVWGDPLPQLWKASDREPFSLPKPPPISKLWKLVAIFIVGAILATAAYLVPWERFRRLLPSAQKTAPATPSAEPPKANPTTGPTLAAPTPAGPPGPSNSASPAKATTPAGQARRSGPAPTAPQTPAPSAKSPKSNPKPPPMQPTKPPPTQTAQPKPNPKGSKQASPPVTPGPTAASTVPRRPDITCQLRTRLRYDQGGV